MSSPTDAPLWLNVDKPVKSLVIHNQNGCWDERKKGRGEFKPVGQLGKDGGWLPFQNHTAIENYARKEWSHFPPPYPCSNCLKSKLLGDLTEPTESTSEAEADAEEGNRVLAKHHRIERDPKIIAKKRKAVIAAQKTLACEACGFDFQKIYGKYGEGFCEVHHLKPLGELAHGKKVVTRLEHLAIVCSNCHRMIHRSHPCLTIEYLRHVMRSSPCNL